MSKTSKINKKSIVQERTMKQLMETKGACLYCRDKPKTYGSVSAWYTHFKKQHENKYTGENSQEHILKAKRAGSRHFLRTAGLISYSDQSNSQQEIEEIDTKKGKKRGKKQDEEKDIVRLSEIDHNKNQTQNVTMNAKFHQKIRAYWTSNLTLQKQQPFEKFVMYDPQIQQDDEEIYQYDDEEVLRQQKFMKLLVSNGIPIQAIQTTKEFNNYRFVQHGYPIPQDFEFNFAWDVLKRFSSKYAMMIYCKICLVIGEHQTIQNKEAYSCYERYERYSFLNRSLSLHYQDWLKLLAKSQIQFKSRSQQPK